MTSVLLVDDHALMREGLRTLLSAQPDIDVIGEAGDGEDGIQRAIETEPDIVVMDIGMPRMDGIEATRRLTSLAPAVKIVALSMHADRRFVTEMLRAGADAYVLKQGCFQELLDAIEAVRADETYLSPRVAGIVVEQLRTPVSRDGNVLATLTQREREVLQCVVEGLNTKAIAFKLGLSGKTVDGHRRAMMQKLGMQSVAELTLLAVREGLVEGKDEESE